MTTDRKIFQSHKFRAIIDENQISGCSEGGIALDLGSRDRAFESPHSDQEKRLFSNENAVFLCFFEAYYTK